MKHNNKKILPIMLTLCMVLSLFSGAAVTANATGGGTERNITLDLTGDSITDTNGTTIVADGNGVYTCQAEGWTWDSTNSTLTLDNCRIEMTSGNGIKLPETNINLVLKGENHIYAKDGSAITGCQNNTFTISGSGSLETNATGMQHISCGNLVLEGGGVNLVVSSTSSAYMGINVTKSLTVNGGTLRAEGFKNGAIYSNRGKVAINGGHVTISVVSGTAIAGTNDITVDSKLTIVGGDSAEGAQSITSIGKEKYLDITAPAAATFTDGFGNTIDNADTYIKDKTKHSTKTDYTFAGWFDSTGNPLTDVKDAVAGTTYTAKWKKDGKTVRTMPLDLTETTITDTTGKEITVDNGVYRCDEEGWIWTPANGLLSLTDCTIDTTDGDGIKLNQNVVSITFAGKNLVTATGENSSGINHTGSSLNSLTMAMQQGADNATLSLSGKYRGLRTESAVYLKSGTVTATGAGGVDCRSLEVQGGTLRATGSTSYGIYAHTGTGQGMQYGVVEIGVAGEVDASGEIGIVCKPLEVNGTMTAQGSAKAVWIDNQGNDDAPRIKEGLTVKTNIEAAEGAGDYEAANIASYKWLHVVAVPKQQYTVTYNTNGGTMTEDTTLTVAEGSQLTAPADPTKGGYYFVGWYKDAAFSAPWNFATDTVTGNVTLYAKWSTDPVYSISGTVKKARDGGAASAVQNATVELKKAGEPDAIAIKQTGANGEYRFDSVPDGVYNIVVTNGTGATAEVVTKLITVSGENKEEINITLPKDKVSSVVEIKESTRPVLVGGLEQVASKVKADNTSANSVKVVMTVEKKAESDVSAEVAGIKDLASGKVLEYLNIELKKFIGDNATGTTISDTETNVLEIIVPYDMTGKNNITVYRHHDGNAKAFRQLSSLVDNNKGDGTYYLDKDNNLIHIFTNKFSTYAIGYNTSSGSSSGGSYIVQKPEVTTNTGGKAELSTNGTTVTITPDVGYEIESVLLNGKDMGKVNKLTGLKTGDKVVVTFQKKSVVDTKTIVDKVGKMKLTARSAKTTKKNIRITVKTDKETNNLIKEIKDLGYTVKYKYYRSTKKASKYTARIEKDASINSFINTVGKKGTRYYYRVKVMVYDADGNFIAKSDLKQCKYAARIWSK